jgi:pimeloyl-ACP methyl ester carboxylesterase
MGGGGRGRRPSTEPTADDDAPRQTPRWLRIMQRAAGVLLVIVLVAGLWWIVNGRHRSASDATACRSAVEEAWVRGGAECLHFEEYRSASLTAHPDLVVVIHGDAPFQRPGYQYAAARRITSDIGNVIAIGLLRPGYTDPDGHRSSGIRGRGIGDNYRPQDVDAIAGAVSSLADTYLPGRVFLVGHSGGAVIAADIIGRHPSLVTGGAILVSCPCDVPVWRRHMDSVQRNPFWRVPVQSLSPMDLAVQVDTHTVVRAIVGSADTIAPPPFSRAYVQRLQARRVRADLVEVPGAGHDILLDPRVLGEIGAVIGR